MTEQKIMEQTSLFEILVVVEGESVTLELVVVELSVQRRVEDLQQRQWARSWRFPSVKATTLLSRFATRTSRFRPARPRSSRNAFYRA